MKKLNSVELQELSEAYQKVLYWFFSFPDLESSLNELASDLEISKTTANRVVSNLEREGFLQKKVYGRTWRITCDKQHVYNITRKVAFNLHQVMEAYHGGLRNHIMKTVGSANAIILFGSYRKGDDTQDSDIDIAVEVNDNEDLRVVQLGVVPQFGYRKNVPINLHIFCRNKVDINLFANIANGIVLEGFLEVKP